MSEHLMILVQALGGLGLFLLGMIIMTDSLRSLVANRLRAALMRFTRTPASGALMGSCCTAILQSSSATILAVVGFVGAELMTFPNALGVIFGADVGTTITGWLVTLLGFKLKIHLVVLPLILVGALMRLFGSGNLAFAGLALAGFGLIFVGIGQMQQAMESMRSMISFDNLPADNLTGRLKLVLMGLIFTLITQSSSAGVATTLTALYTGMLQFEQAAALVIGMDVGTTITALFATIGGSLGARRTGYSHVIYNLMTASVAVLLISPYVSLWEWLAPGQLNENAQLALVAFHSTFNILGVIIAVPLARQFARMIETIVPAPSNSYTRLLDDALLDQPKLALNAIHGAIVLQLPSLLNHINAILGDRQSGSRTDLATLQRSLDETHAYIDRIHLSKSESPEWLRLIALIHTLDHLQRLHERCEEEEDRALVVSRSTLLAAERQRQISSNQAIVAKLRAGHWQQCHLAAKNARHFIEQRVEQHRQSIVAAIGRGEMDVPEGTDNLEAIRWLSRVGIHTARITHHLEQAVLLS